MKKLLCFLFLGISALSFGMRRILPGGGSQQLPGLTILPPGTLTTVPSSGTGTTLVIGSEQQNQRVSEINQMLETPQQRDEREYLEALRELEIEEIREELRLQNESYYDESDSEDLESYRFDDESGEYRQIEE